MTELHRMCIKGFRGLCNEIVYNDNSLYYSVHPSSRVETECVNNSRHVAIWKSVSTYGWKIYTDASVSSYGAGWAFVVFHHGFCLARDFSALTRCSIFDAEAFAIFKTVQFTKKIRYLQSTETVEVRTDSLSIVMALKKVVCIDPVLAPIKQVLREVYEIGINVVIVWIPSHSDICGNEYVDSLAKKAIDASEVCKIKVHMRELCRVISETEKKKIERKWTAYTGRIPKAFMPTLLNVSAFIKSSPSVPLTQLVSGHSRLNEFVYVKYGIIESPMCMCEEEEETVEHFLFTCPIYEKIRNEIWPNFYPTFDYVTDDWTKLNDYVLRTKRFATASLQRKIDLQHEPSIDDRAISEVDESR